MIVLNATARGATVEEAALAMREALAAVEAGERISFNTRDGRGYSFVVADDSEEETG